MQPNSAYSQVAIVVNTDYTPTQQYTTHVDPNIGPTSPAGPTVQNGFNSPVYGLFCTVTNTSTVQIQCLGDASPVSYPAGAFKQGVVYYMYLKKLVADGGGAFIGFRYTTYPLAL